MGIDLKPLPREFLDNWNNIYQKWISIKTNIANNIIKSTNSEEPIDKVEEGAAFRTLFLPAPRQRLQQRYQNGMLHKVGEIAGVINVPIVHGPIIAQRLAIMSPIPISRQTP